MPSRIEHDDTRKHHFKLSLDHMDDKNTRNPHIIHISNRGIHHHYQHEANAKKITSNINNAERFSVRVGRQTRMISSQVRCVVVSIRLLFT